MEFGKTFCAVTALKQETAPAGDIAESFFQRTRLTGKDQRRKTLSTFAPPA